MKEDAKETWLSAWLLSPRRRQAIADTWKSLLLSSEEPKLEAAKQSRPLCRSQPEQQDQPCVNSSAHSNTHIDAQRCRAKKPGPILASLFFHPEHLLEKEKKNQEDCRLEKKRGFHRGKRKTREDKWTESSRGEARNWKDSKLYTSLSGNYTYTEHHKHFLIWGLLRNQNTNKPECAFLHIATGLLWYPENISDRCLQPRRWTTTARAVELSIGMNFKRTFQPCRRSGQ